MHPYFKGWYFKIQNRETTVAVIPALHREKTGREWASIQIVTADGATLIPFANAAKTGPGNAPRLSLGNNEFSERGLRLDIDDGNFQAKGALRFGALTPLAYDIMGPFRFVPAMECRHAVFSMGHRVDGSLELNGKSHCFDGGRGYLEGDRGRSFPINYLWTQVNFGENSGDGLMLSMAEIPLGPFRFTGIIGVLSLEGREYRLATYLGARPEKIGNRIAVVRQQDLRLTAQLRDGGMSPLYAPVRGDMKRRVREGLCCGAYYRLEKRGKTIWELDTKQASFEYEYPF